MKTNLMMKVVAAAVVALISVSALAQDVGVVVGVRSDNADGNNNVKITGKTGFQAGVVAKFDMTSALQLRSGFLATQRSYEYSITTPAILNDEYKMTYFEIPVGVLWKFSDYGGVFAGPAISLNLSKSCPGGDCSGTEVNSSPLSFQFGGSFKVAPQVGFEVYYESMLNDVSKDVKSGRSLMANLMITFD